MASDLKVAREVERALNPRVHLLRSTGPVVYCGDHYVEMKLTWRPDEISCPECLQAYRSLSR